MGTDRIVPTSREAVLVLDSPTLYLLEQAGEIAREILGARIVDWSAQGWTQQAIADEIGCDRSHAIAIERPRGARTPEARRAGVG